MKRTAAITPPSGARHHEKIYRFCTGYRADWRSSGHPAVQGHPNVQDTFRYRRQPSEYVHSNPDWRWQCHDHECKQQLGVPSRRQAGEWQQQQMLCSPDKKRAEVMGAVAEREARWQNKYPKTAQITDL
jgi:hypothetical protein